MFNPSEHFMDLKGKNYLQVMWRLVWLREEHPDWSINTEALELTNERAIFKATICDNDGKLIAQAHGSETPKDFRDYIEKAETKAVGRCLAYVGYGTQFAADELDEGEHIVDSPVKSNKKDYKKGEQFDYSSGDENYKPTVCVRCGGKITEAKTKNKTFTPSEIVLNSKLKYGDVYCFGCMMKLAGEKKEIEKDFVSNG